VYYGRQNYKTAKIKYAYKIKMHQRSCASDFDSTTRSCDVMQILHSDLNKHINLERHLSFMLP
jgi:hypothetical protein